MWGLGNIAGDSSAFRDLILGYSGVDAIIRTLERTQKRTVFTNGIWALSNLCRAKPIAQWSLVSRAVPTFCNAIKTETDSQTLSDAAWGLYYISEQMECVKYLTSLEIIPYLIHYLR